MFLLSPLFLGPFGQFSIRSQVWDTKWSRDASHHKSPSPMMIITPLRPRILPANQRTVLRLDGTGQSEACIWLECSHSSQNPTLVVIIAGLTLSSLSGPWFLTNYPECLVSAVLKRPLCSVVTGQSHENNYTSPTDPEAAPPSPLCRVPQHQVVDTLTKNCSQLVPYKVVTDPGYSSSTQDRRITGTKFYQQITKTLVLSLHSLMGSYEPWKGLWLKTGHGS